MIYICCLLSKNTTEKYSLNSRKRRNLCQDRLPQHLLPPYIRDYGKYRIGKEITDFRVTGDYDDAVYFVEFEIE